eukprot:8847117-Alexandrium_andersonii.AAC.1
MCIRDSSRASASCSTIALVRTAGGATSRVCVNGMRGYLPCAVRSTGSSLRRRSMGPWDSAATLRRIIRTNVSSSGSNASTVSAARETPRA